MAASSAAGDICGCSCFSRLIRTGQENDRLRRRLGKVDQLDLIVLNMRRSSMETVRALKSLTTDCRQSPDPLTRQKLRLAATAERDLAHWWAEADKIRGEIEDQVDQEEEDDEDEDPFGLNPLGAALDNGLATSRQLMALTGPEDDGYLVEYQDNDQDQDLDQLGRGQELIVANNSGLEAAATALERPSRNSSSLIKIELEEIETIEDDETNNNNALNEQRTTTDDGDDDEEGEFDLDNGLEAGFQFMSNQFTGGRRSSSHSPNVLFTSAKPRPADVSSLPSIASSSGSFPKDLPLDERPRKHRPFSKSTGGGNHSALKTNAANKTIDSQMNSSQKEVSLAKTTQQQQLAKQPIRPRGYANRPKNYALKSFSPLKITPSEPLRSDRPRRKCSLEALQSLRALEADELDDRPPTKVAKRRPPIGSQKQAYVQQRRRIIRAANRGVVGAVNSNSQVIVPRKSSRSQYSDQMKLTALEFAKKNGFRKAARHFGIGKSSIHNWANQEQQIRANVSYQKSASDRAILEAGSSVASLLASPDSTSQLKIKPVKLIQCNICGGKFTRMDNYTRHRAMHQSMQSMAASAVAKANIKTGIKWQPKRQAVKHRPVVKSTQVVTKSQVVTKNRVVTCSGRDTRQQTELQIGF